MITPADDKAMYLEEELLLVANSGEIPEIALHGSLYFLREDPDGPSLVLTADDIAPLRQAAFDRYRKILCRDLNPGLRDKRVYRGLARCRANWHRFRSFCHRQDMDPTIVRVELATLLSTFLHHEARDHRAGRRTNSSINCTATELCSLVDELKLDPTTLPPEWQSLCLPEE